MQPTRSWFGVCRTVELLHVKKTLKRHLIQHTAAYVTNQKRVQHVRTWLTLPNDWPQTMKVYRLALQLRWFPKTKSTWHDTQGKNWIANLQNNPAPFALPSSRAVSFAWKFRPSWSWWLCSFLKRMPGRDVCGTMLPFNISHHNNLQGQWGSKYPLAHFQCWGQHF